MKEQLIKTLNRVSNNEGILGNDLKEATMISFNNLDDYLAVKVLALMIEAGDIELTVVGDTLGKKDYLKRLLSNVPEQKKP